MVKRYLINNNNNSFVNDCIYDTVISQPDTKVIIPFTVDFFDIYLFRVFISYQTPD